MKFLIGTILMLIAAVYGSAGLICACIYLKLPNPSGTCILFFGLLRPEELLIVGCGILWFVHFIPGIAMVNSPDKRARNLEGELSFDTKRTV